MKASLQSVLFAELKLRILRFGSPNGKIFFATVHDTVVTVNWRRRKMKTWLSFTTIRLTRIKQLCNRKLKKVFTTTLQEKYNHLCNKVRSVTRYDFKAYVDSVTEDLCHYQRTLWNWINKLRCCRNPIPPIYHNNKPVTDDSAKASLFNQYFVSLFTKDLSSLPEVPPFCSGFTLVCNFL